MSEIKIGILSDLHSVRTDPDFNSRLSESLKHSNLDLIVFLGDFLKDLRAHPQLQVEQIQNHLLLLDSIGIPVYCGAGDLDMFPIYDQAFSILDYNDVLRNVSDISRLGKTRYVKDGIELDFIFIPGSNKEPRGFLVSDKYPTNYYEINGIPFYVFNPNDLRDLVEDPSKTVILGHQPPHIPGNKSIDLKLNADPRSIIETIEKIQTPNDSLKSLRDLCIKSEGRPLTGIDAYRLVEQGLASPVISHKGSSLLTQIFKELNIVYGFFGHVHEAPGIVDIEGRQIENSNEPYSQLFLNPGSLERGDYGVFTFGDNTISFLRKNIFTGNPTEHCSRYLE